MDASTNAVEQEADSQTIMKLRLQRFQEWLQVSLLLTSWIGLKFARHFRIWTGVILQSHIAVFTKELQSVTRLSESSISIIRWPLQCKSSKI